MADQTSDLAREPDHLLKVVEPYFDALLDGSKPLVTSKSLPSGMHGQDGPS